MSHVMTGRIQLSQTSWLEHTPGWLSDADATMTALRHELSWTQEHLWMFGKQVPQPRLTAVCGKSMDPASRYRTAKADTPWPPTAKRVLDRITSEMPGWTPNGLIANWYRNGSDSIGWHSDAEPALGPSPIVVSVSLGGTRDFLLRPKPGGPRTVVKLAHSDLLVMAGDTQLEFQHSIAKTTRHMTPRLSLTFRRYRSGSE